MQKLARSRFSSSMLRMGFAAAQRSIGETATKTLRGIEAVVCDRPCGKGVRNRFHPRGKSRQNGS